MAELRSSDLEDYLESIGELELQTAFKAMVGCDGDKLFVSINDEVFDYHDKASRYNQYRELLIKRKDFIIELAKEAKLDYTPLFNEIENIVKRVCKELGLTYKQLGEAIGYSESAVNNASRGEVSKAMQKAIELYVENLALKKDIENSNKIKSTLKEWLN